MRKWCGLSNLDYRKEDFFAQDLSFADAVIFYLSSYEMAPLGKKLRENLRPGTLVISNRFKLKSGWISQRTVQAKTLFPFEKEFFVYEQGL